MRLILAFRAALVLALMACVATVAQAQDSYRIKPGDVLQVEVLEDASLNRSTLVLPDGRISLPLAGTIRAGGRTIEDVQADLAAKLAPNFATTPNVFVGLATLAAAPVPTGPAVPKTINVFVMGEVGKPGKLQVEPGTTLLQMFAEFGGFSNFAATKRIQLRRVDKSGVERVYTINYRTLESGSALQVNTVMSDGDVIVVPQRRLFE